MLWKKQMKGFTLLELLVTIAVIAVIAAITVPMVGDILPATKNRTVEEAQKTVDEFVSKWNSTGAYTFDPTTATWTGYVDLNGDGVATSDEAVEQIDLNEQQYTIDRSHGDAPTGLSGVDYAFTPNDVFTIGGATSTSFGVLPLYDPITFTYLNTAFTSGSNFQTLTASVTGGATDKSYSLTGTLPTGVTFDTATGTFTGPASTAWSMSPIYTTGDGAAVIHDMAQASDGTLWVTGQFNGTVTFGEAGTLSGTGGTTWGTDAFVAKVSSTGTWQWVSQGGGDFNDKATNIHLNADGSATIVGEAVNAVAFGSVTGTAKGTDIFVAKISSTGTWQSLVLGGGTSNESVRSAAVDANGNVVVVGVVVGSTEFGSYGGFTAFGGNDMFVAKLSSAGEWLWATTAGGSGQDEAFGVDIASNGTVYITGYFSGSAYFGLYQSATSNGSGDIFVAALTPTGTWQWIRGFGSTAYDAGKAIIATDSGPIVTGFFRSTMQAAGNTLTASGGSADVFTIRLTSAGAPVWSSSFGTSSYNGVPFAIEQLSDGSVVVAGTGASNTVQVTRLGLNDSVTWQTSTSVPNSYSPQSALVVTANDGIKVAGRITSATTIGSTTVTPTGTASAVAFEVNADGSIGQAGFPTTVDVTVTDSSGSQTTTITLSVN